MVASALTRTDPLEAAGQYFDDPLGFVRFAFDWGHGELKHHKGPRQWQRDALAAIGDAVKARGFDGVTPVAPVQMATASGHGIGKSALTAFIILWIMSTRPRCKGVVTANTADQLKTKTWAELATWRKRCITGEFFDMSTSKGNLSITAKSAPETWRFDGLTCREENSEAFAGQHAADSSSVYIFDEASAVPDKIWEVAEGGLTDGEPFFLAFGNPTRNDGRFRRCFGDLKHRWSTKQIDSRTVEGTNSALHQQWADDYGEDSDFFRVRVRGMFPRASSLQFIASDVVAAARSRVSSGVIGDPVIMGVDVARFGDDESVIAVRRGRDARTIPWQRFRGVDTQDLAGRVAEIARTIRADGIFVDAGGVGGGVVDRLRKLRIWGVVGVDFGRASDMTALRLPETDAGGERYANKRAEMWAGLRSWLAGGGSIPDLADLETQLTSVPYGFDAKDRILLARKEDMKKLGFESPDLGDALALTFAYPVGVRPLQRDEAVGAAGPVTVSSDYDPMKELGWR